MSCCGFPPRSQEPEYPLPAALSALARKWDNDHPGVFDAIRGEIGRGNWDELCSDGMDVPAYSIQQAFEVAIAQLAQFLLSEQQAAQMKKGPWLVRWGLAKPLAELSPAAGQALEYATKEAHEVLRSITTNPPASSRPYPLLFL